MDGVSEVTGPMQGHTVPRSLHSQGQEGSGGMPGVRAEPA